MEGRVRGVGLEAVLDADTCALDGMIDRCEMRGVLQRIECTESIANMCSSMLSFSSKGNHNVSEIMREQRLMFTVLSRPQYQVQPNRRRMLVIASA